MTLNDNRPAWSLDTTTFLTSLNASVSARVSYRRDGWGRSLEPELSSAYGKVAQTLRSAVSLIGIREVTDTGVISRP